MSQQDLWAVIGRARSDLNFGGALFSDFEATVKREGYRLDPQEVEQARAQLRAGPPPPAMAMGSPDTDAQRQFREKGMLRVAALYENVFESLKTTLNAAARTYKIITWMNTIMFGSGLGLFLF